MSLSIVAAKDLEQACAVLSARPGKAMRVRTAEEPEAVGNFLYDFRAAFTNYETYYRFDPYRETLLGPDQVLAIRASADSVVTLLSEHEAEENHVIETYGVSFSKIRRFAAALRLVCDAAVEQGCGLAGIGD